MPSLLDFFEQVVPNDGLLANVTIGSDKKVRHHIFSDKTSLANDCGNRAIYGAEDLYFALASFKQGWHSIINKKGKSVQVFRTQNNVHHLKSLWLDIDVGADKPYKDTKSALVALRSFISEVKLPLPWIILSGSGGMHVYWTFNEGVTSEDWQVVADKLHAATIEHNLDADPSRTRDCASILRVPSSKNYKSGEPKPVKAIAYGESHSFSLFVGLLSDYKVTEPVNTTVTDTTMPCSLETLNRIFGGVSNPPAATIEAPIVGSDKDKEASVVVAGCQQIRDQNGAPEPVWRGMLSVMRHCQGGYAMAHDLSAKDPRYNKADTDAKITQLEDKDIAPYRCDSFRAERPEICKACQYNNVINSPISVPESRIAVVQIPTNLPTGSIETPVLSEAYKYFKPYATNKYKVTEGGCYESVVINDKDTWIKIFGDPIYPIQKIRDFTDSGDVQISFIFRRHTYKGHYDFQIPGEVLGGSGISSFLGGVGILVGVGRRKAMAGFLVDIVKEADSDIEEVDVANNLGWDSDHKNFLLGNKVYKPNGDVIDVTPKGKAQEFSRLTVPKGDLESWKKIADVYNTKGLEWAQVVIGTAFASPLMSMGSLERAALLFITGDKGTGKSTALQVAMSVYGDPIHMMINKNDTEISRYHKLGVLNSISAAFDEMTDLSPSEASRLAYQITQGRGKSRMGEYGKNMQRNTTEWSCLPVMSANDSIISSLAQHKMMDTTAQMSRVLEVEATSFNDYYSKKDAESFQKTVRTMPRNYGTAGDVYIRYIVANQDKVEGMILDMEKIFVAETRLNSTYRFWSYMCTRLLVGCSIAKSLGLINYDIKNMFVYLKSLIEKSLSNMGQYEWKTESLLSDFLNSHLANRIDVISSNRPPDMVDDPKRGLANDITYVTRPVALGRELQIRVELEQGIGYISKHAVRQWCKLNSVPYDKFLDSIRDSGLLLASNRRIALGKGTAHRDTGRSYCLEIKMPDDQVE